MESNHSIYPNRQKCLDILAEIKCPEQVITHILVVTEIALKIARYFPKADPQLIEAGALLHDIGRVKTHGILHAVEGTKIAKQYGLPDKVISIIERHIAAGIPQKDALELGLPPKDYTPITIEERIVAHADNLVDGYKRCKIARSEEILLNKGLSEVAKRVKELHEALSSEAGIDIDDV